jgi:putative phage-type endonuclease
MARDARARAAWLEARRSGIGASDAPVLLGLTRRDPLSIYASKLGLVADSDDETEAQEWGWRLEDAIADAYRDKTRRCLGPPAPYQILRHPEHPCLSATLDRTITATPDGGEVPAVLELKTTGAFFADEWEDEAPLAYQVQVQHQLMVTGWAWGSIAVLIGGQKFRYIDRIERNEHFIKKLIAVELKFWRYVERQEPPAEFLTGASSTREALAALYPTVENQELVPLAAQALDWHEDLADTKNQIKVLTERKDLAENRLRLAIGDALGGVLPDGTVYTLKEQSRSGYSVPPWTGRVLRCKASRR